MRTSHHSRKSLAGLCLGVLLSLSLVAAACSSSDNSATDIVSTGPSDVFNSPGSSEGTSLSEGVSLSEAQTELAERWLQDARIYASNLSEGSDEFWSGMQCFARRAASLLPDSAILESGVLGRTTDSEDEQSFADFTWEPDSLQLLGSAFRECLLETNVYTNVYSEALRTSILEELGITSTSESDSGLQEAANNYADSVACLSGRLFDPYTDEELGEMVVTDGSLFENTDLGDNYDYLGRVFVACDVLASGLEYEDADIKSKGGTGLSEFERCLAVETYARLTHEQIGRIVGDDQAELEDDEGFSGASVAALSICSEDS